MVEPQVLKLHRLHHYKRLLDQSIIKLGHTSASNIEKHNFITDSLLFVEINKLLQNRKAIS